jgi:hypothetical protein
MGGKTMLRHFEHIGSGNIHASLNAPETHHTSIRPLSNQRSPIGFGRNLSLFWREVILSNSKFIGPVLKLTFSSCITDRTVQRMVDQ